MLIYKMPNKIINRKNITISQNLVSVVSGRFTKNIFLNFQPDEMIVKLIVYNGDATNRKLGAVRLFCQTIGEDLGSFYDGSCVSPNLSFIAKNYPINSEWTFQLYDANGAVNSTLDDELFFHLSFVKYE